MRYTSIIRLILLALFCTSEMAAAAGEGTIPLRVTGRVVGSPHERIVSNAKAEIKRAQQLPTQALTCLQGKRVVRKYLTRGKLTLKGRQTEILAICIEEAGGSIEIFTQEANGAIYRVIGRHKTAK